MGMNDVTNQEATKIAREALRQITRRHFFRECRFGVGAMALACLWEQELRSASRARIAPPPPGYVEGSRGWHHTPRAKNVIFLFMAGGPSQLDLFTDKPRLRELHGEVIPASFVEGKRFAFIKPDAKLLGSRWKFNKYGEAGVEVSELLPHFAQIVDDVTVIRSLKTDVFNHGPAKLFMNTGSPQFSGRPSMGAWITYGIGSESQSLPGFVVLQSGPRGPRGGAPLWSSGFLPTNYQGVPFRSGPEPVLNLSNPAGIDHQHQERFIRTLNHLNRQHEEEWGDPEIATRIAQYEMAFRMQTSAPELMDLSGETLATLEMYGATPGKPSFANNCLLARRLVERGVRFVQLYHTDWDHHGGVGFDLEKALRARCEEVDRASAALVRDLKQRGMLEETIVIWAGEFGRTPQGEVRGLIGRDHHIESFTIWVAGGGFKAGAVVGETDEIGYYPVEDPVHVHDLHATILHLLGIDHLRLVYRFQGRHFRLTDVHGEVVQKLLA
ncbi:MAG: sulfatase [Planctomycetaceae bacterium]|nr:MAG: sulfatase [Planctomycetaceae bacterium]